MSDAIRGKEMALDMKGRSVFVGHRGEDRGTYYIQFRNEEGRLTRLTLSAAAAAVLSDLIQGKDIGAIPKSIPLGERIKKELHWVQVEAKP